VVLGSEYSHTDDGVFCNVYLGFSTAGVSVVEKEERAYEQIAIFGEVQPGLWKGDLEIARILADSLQGNPNVQFTEGSPNFDRLWAAEVYDKLFEWVADSAVELKPTVKTKGTI